MISSSIQAFVFGLVVAVSDSVNAAATLNPTQDILLPSSGSAKAPLEWLGGNSPWFAGPDINNVANSVPESCTVEQAAYVSRHGSRYPDNGAYAEWVALQTKIAAAGKFEAKGSLAFLSTWKPVLTNTTVQIAQESLTGYKESYDLGYTLRLRYPNLYTEGAKFLAWSNLYPRVVQTARMFVRGYLGPNADTLGQVITVNSTGSPAALGNSLSPGDLCKNYTDGSGGTYITEWQAIYVPPIVKRLNKLLSGGLTFNSSDVTLFPYLCGFESQILGKLSSWCGVFTDEELLDYAYAQDLRYYYGQGPGMPVVERTIMLPFLSNLVKLLAAGPGGKGIDASGKAFILPDLFVAFLNDGQISSLGAVTGIFANQKELSGTKRPTGKDYIYSASHFITMRGTIAFERLNCEITTETEVTSYNSHHQMVKSEKISTKNETFIRILLNDAVYPVPKCESGPGASCLLSNYVAKIAAEVEATGNWVKNCGTTTVGSPTTAVGAGFFTNLGLSWLASITP